MYTAAASTVLLAVFGQINFAYVLYLAVWGGIGVILGMYFIGKLLKKFKRQSIVAICLAIILSVATIFSGVMNSLSLKSKSDSGLDILKGGEVCE